MILVMNNINDKDKVKVEHKIVEVINGFQVKYNYVADILTLGKMDEKKTSISKYVSSNM